MAAFTLSSAPAVRNFGRSGYNKDDDDTTKGNKGRFTEYSSDTTALLDFGRSGYNKDDEDGKPKKNDDEGRSGYN